MLAIIIVLIIRIPISMGNEHNAHSDHTDSIASLPHVHIAQRAMICCIINLGRVDRDDNVFSDSSFGL